MIPQRPAICKRVERNFYKHHRPSAAHSFEPTER
jgi:hypothetical protein